MPHLDANADLNALGYLDDQALASVDAWWRASNYLTVGQIYLRDNVLLQRPLAVGAYQPADQRDRSANDLPGRTGPRRSRPGRRRMVGGNLHRDLSRRDQRCGGASGSVPTVLDPWRHPKSRLRSDAGFHP